MRRCTAFQAVLGIFGILYRLRELHLCMMVKYYYGSGKVNGSKKIECNDPVSLWKGKKYINSVMERIEVETMVQLIGQLTEAAGRDDGADM